MYPPSLLNEILIFDLTQLHKRNRLARYMEDRILQLVVSVHLKITSLLRPVQVNSNITSHCQFNRPIPFCQVMLLFILFINNFV